MAVLLTCFSLQSCRLILSRCHLSLPSLRLWLLFKCKCAEMSLMFLNILHCSFGASCRQWADSLELLSLCLSPLSPLSCLWQPTYLKRKSKWHSTQVALARTFLFKCIFISTKTGKKSFRGHTVATVGGRSSIVIVIPLSFSQLVDRHCHNVTTHALQHATTLLANTLPPKPPFATHFTSTVLFPIPVSHPHAHTFI